MTDPGSLQDPRPRFRRTDPWLARSAAPDPGRLAASRLVPGTLLAGGYRILSVLAEGGMAVVYEAEDVGNQARLAVKVLQPLEAESLAGVARFLAEIQVAGTLRHPNLVAVTASGTAPNGLPFLVMPLLEGASLAEVLAARGPLPTDETARILEQILGGLAAAHDQGIVHRDLKPGNVFLARNGDRQTPIIIDFGVARFSGDSPPGQDPRPGGTPPDGRSPRGRLTRGGRVMGTPGYLAPEIASDSPAVDHRSDLFSVAVLAFEMLTGRLPFVGDTDREVLIATVEHPVPRPRALRPELSLAMERVVLTGLAKRPEDRFQTASEFRLHLAAAAKGTTPRDARPCVTETRELATGSSGAFCVLSGGDAAAGSW